MQARGNWLTAFEYGVRDAKAGLIVWAVSCMNALIRVMSGSVSLSVKFGLPDGIYPSRPT